jgi:hypothetical protein
MPKYPQSRYVLIVENLAPATRSADVRYEMEYYGDVRRCERDCSMRMALVEFERCATVLCMLRACSCTQRWRQGTTMRLVLRC